MTTQDLRSSVMLEELRYQNVKAVHILLVHVHVDTYVTCIVQPRANAHVEKTSVYRSLHAYAVEIS